MPSGDDAYRAKDQGVFGKVLAVFFVSDAFQQIEHMDLLLNQNRLADISVSRDYKESHYSLSPIHSIYGCVLVIISNAVDLLVIGVDSFNSVMT